MKPGPSIFLFAILAGVAGPVGCGALSEPVKWVVVGNPTPPDPKTLPPPRHYPQDLPIGEPLPIEVVRSGSTFYFDNRSTRSYRDVEVWLNLQYGARIREIPIGRSQPIPMRRFVNHHSERYPTGSFLRPKDNRPLLLVDLVLDGKIRKTTTRLTEGWQRP
ncbi:MAG: hypothetical protein R3236_07295 [Phycisphaeraceae bacterium]|nr:hypothetical protein [Phycisphaeraceae bacterium]